MSKPKGHKKSCRCIICRRAKKQRRCRGRKTKR